MSAKMNVLVIGSGGREHAIVYALALSKLAGKIFCAPGNAGIAGLAECLDIKPEDIGQLGDFASREKIDLTVVGPEAPLACGISDEFKARGLKIFGPSAKASQLESSKVFAKNIMAEFSIPTAAFEVFDDPRAAEAFIEKNNGRCVVKADGLAQGKGVVVALNKSEALSAVDSMMRRKTFGKAGEKIIIEELLTGQEASIIVLTDGKKIVPMASSQDHKRVFDGDRGANTGGMGAYSPAGLVTRELYEEIEEKVLKPVISGLASKGIDYQGALYAGIMVTPQGPKVLEFNVRFGDPETQAILPRMRSDLLELMLACANTSLGKYVRASGGINWDSKTCVCVVCASGGYPGSFEKGKEISGLDKTSRLEDTVIFHSGTLISKEGGKNKVLTNGGRVLGVCGLGEGITKARDNAYRAVKEINFAGMHYRTDIAVKAIK